MNSKLISVLAIVCGLLMVIIIGEWVYAVHAQKQLLLSTPPAETRQSADEMPVIDLAQRSEESYTDMVARPLFLKGRKPVNEPRVKGNEAVVANVKFDWQLNGVYSKQKTLKAFFSRATAKVPKDNYRKLAIGEDIDGWKLAEIHPDRVILVQSTEQKELQLRKPKLKALPQNKNNPAPQPAPVNQPAPPPAPEPSPSETESDTDTESMPPEPLPPPDSESMAPVPEPIPMDESESPENNFENGNNE